MDEDFFNNELIEGFEQMLDNREYKYYDAEDLVEIIEFYLEVNDSEYAKRALDFAEKMHPENIDIKIKRRFHNSNFFYLFPYFINTLTMVYILIGLKAPCFHLF